MLRRLGKHAGFPLVDDIIVATATGVSLTTLAMKILYLRPVEQVDCRRGISTVCEMVSGSILTMTPIQVDDVESDASRFQQDVCYGSDAYIIDFCAKRHYTCFHIGGDSLRWENEISVLARASLDPGSSE